MRRDSGVRVVALVAFLASAVAGFADDRADLDRAQKLAWSKHFAEAEQIYRDVLAHAPDSREAAHGLAQVTLWQGRYREARSRFLALGDREGAATAAYWQGDFRTAAREFSGLDSQFARESLVAIEQASRGMDRIDVDSLHDNQPLRTFRSSATSSMFSDPLTRWDVTAGGSLLSAPRFEERRRLAFASVANERVLPWQRLTIDSSFGVQRYPDGSSRPVGGVALRYRPSNESTFAASIEHRELLTNDTAMARHPSVTRSVISWTRYRERSWFAGFENGSLRYFDRNRGRYAQGYALLPVAVHRTPVAVYLGASAAIRDTAENRFGLDAFSGSRSSTGDFVYSYRGSYTPYWTPKHLREARAIALVTGTINRVSWKAQFEGGVARDDVIAFGPSRGPAPLPQGIFSFDFVRTSHPARGAITFTTPIASRYSFECTIERSVTAFYAANAIHGSLVRHR